MSDRGGTFGGNGPTPQGESDFHSFWESCCRCCENRSMTQGGLPQTSYARHKRFPHIYNCLLIIFIDIIFYVNKCILKGNFSPGQCGLCWLGLIPETEGWPIQFPVGVHAWAAGSLLHPWTLAEGSRSMFLSCIDVSLPLCLPPCPSLQKIWKETLHYPSKTIYVKRKYSTK